jgi:hypothetical protein
MKLLRHEQRKMSRIWAIFFSFLISIGFDSRITNFWFQHLLLLAPRETDNSATTYNILCKLETWNNFWKSSRQLECHLAKTIIYHAVPHRFYIPSTPPFALLYLFTSFLSFLHSLSDSLFSLYFPNGLSFLLSSSACPLISLQSLWVPHVRCSSVSVPSNPLFLPSEHFSLLYYPVVRYMCYTLSEALHFPYTPLLVPYLRYNTPGCPLL